MRAVLIIALLLAAGVAAAQVCPSPAPADYPSHRPDGVPANYPPPEEPLCFMTDTQTARLPFCSCCHIGRPA